MNTLKINSLISTIIEQELETHKNSTQLISTLGGILIDLLQFINGVTYLRYYIYDDTYLKLQWKLDGDDWGVKLDCSKF